MEQGEADISETGWLSAHLLASPWVPGQLCPTMWFLVAYISRSAAAEPTLGICPAQTHWSTRLPQ